MRPIRMSDVEHAEMVYQLIAGAPEGMTEAELERLTGWLHQARVDAQLVALFDEGEVVIRWREGEADPRFTVSELGEIRARRGSSRLSRLGGEGNA